MKLRYYLRGLGIGIVVTALMMGMTLEAGGRPLTDAEIRAKALTLGMVDADSVSLSQMGGGSADTTGPEAAPPFETPVADGAPETSEEPEEGGEPAVTESPVPTESPSATESPVPTEPPAVTDSPVPTEMPEPTVNTDTGETVTITIVRGDSSYTVSRRLEEAGLIDDAGGFDSYLVNSGYSRTIRTGIYQIPVGASWEEIAEIIA